MARLLDGLMARGISDRAPRRSVIARSVSDAAISSHIVSLNISAKKGQKKQPVDSICLVKDKGVEADAHYDSQRQVSILPVESIQKMKSEGLEVKAGSFAENITTKNLGFDALKVSAKLKLGKALIEITEIGKECHAPCTIYKQAGYCVMPEDGVFAKVLRGGKVRRGDQIEVLK